MMPPTNTENTSESSAKATRKEVLTDRRLKALKPAPKGTRYRIYDAVQPHLSVRVTDRGVVTFFVAKRQPGRSQMRHTLGRYPALTLADAREKARNALKVMATGRTPKEVEAEQRAEEDRKRNDTVGKAIEQFIADQRKSKLRSWPATEAVLRRDFLGELPVNGGKTGNRYTGWTDGPDPIWRNRPILEIRRRDVVARLDAIKAIRGKFPARHAFAAIRKFWNWAAEGERFGVETSPCDRMNAKKALGISADELRRKRVLSDQEIVDCFAACDEIGEPFGPLVKLLLLTGCRVGDLAHARKTEFIENGTILVVGPERFKTKVAFEIMLAPEARSILDSLPTFIGPYLFSTTGGKRPITCFQLMKARLDKAIAKRRSEDGREPMPHWTLHDLRRTVRTRLVANPVRADAYTAERVIGHAKQGLDAVYDQGTHRDEKRDALEKWAKALMAIVGAKKTEEQPAAMIAAE